VGRQGDSGLVLEAQCKTVADFLDGGREDLIAEFVEVGSGKRDDRPRLAKASSLCRLHNATLVIATRDRLSRDAVFLLALQKAGGGSRQTTADSKHLSGVHSADLPT
jgi:DNA invertase Pin-like site-specific DNA recombinase